MPDGSDRRRSGRQGQNYRSEKISDQNNPLVSVVTPVYNREDFLAECIESVLGQSYRNLEYIIVDNCSTDRSLKIALKYAEKDGRIKVHSTEMFVEVMEHHNIALGFISSKAKYCKVVSDFDFIFSDCIEKMVEVAEAEPSVGIVGSFQLYGNCIRWEGFPYPRTVFSGREICRKVFLGGHPGFGFGTPTSILYRADLVRDKGGFYPNSSPHADASACFKHLKSHDFGFVYQVLSYARVHEETDSSKSAEINRFASANLNDLLEYGPFYLNIEEFKKKKTEILKGYHQYLAVQLIKFRGIEFWDYHKRRLKELGHPLKFSMLLKALIIAALRAILNPGKSFNKCLVVLSSRRKQRAFMLSFISSTIFHVMIYGESYVDIF